MSTAKRYDNYPIGIVLFSNFISLAIYALGIFIIYHLTWIIAALYLIYVLALELRVIKSHCTNCFYWGKTCGFGKGRISALFFKKGDESRFCQHEMKWKDMIPDILVSLIPLVFGIIILIVRFQYIMLIAIVLLVLFASFITGYIRGNLTCNYCKQRDLGCPAEQLFNKK